MRKPTRFICGLIVATSGVLSFVALLLEPTALAHPQLTNASWTFTGNLNQARDNHTATLLPNGKVLVAGGLYGAPNFTFLNSAELYDPDTGTWSVTGNLNIARWGHTATLLPNGKVLVAGGWTDSNLGFNTAELYDVATGTWSFSGNLNAHQPLLTGTLLTNGKFLVHGYSGAELYDPTTGNWSAAGSMITNRFYQTATLLPNGNVLVAGGADEDFFTNAIIGFATAELYNSATVSWSPTSNLSKIRWSHTAALLRTGKVLVVGGYNCDGNLNDAELYDPATGTWTGAGHLTTTFEARTATPLTNGKVLVVGVRRSDSVNRCRAELYDPTTGTWSNTIDCGAIRGGYTATLLFNGKVLVAGGGLSSAELYDPGNQPISNPIDDAQLFVRQHYADFLDREPDQGGWDYWTARITECGNDPQCVHQRRIDVSAAFFVELEFQQTGYVVYRLHRAAYGEVITLCNGGFDEEGNPCEPRSRANLAHSQFVTDRAQLVGGPGLPQSTINFANNFVQRLEFKQAYPDAMTASDFVNKLFDMANLTGLANLPHRQAAIEALTNGSRTRGQVLLDVIEIGEFKTREYNPAFVLMQYFGYLRRDPDEGGYYFWLDVVNNREPNNYRGMVCAFITSAEYQMRFGSAVTRTNQDCGQ